MCGKPGHRAFECWFRDSGNNRNGSGNNGMGQGRVFTCYNCGKEGHRSFECPNKGKSVNTKKEKEPETVNQFPVDVRHGCIISCLTKNVLKGVINGHNVKVLLDSGANYGMVPPEAYLGQKCLVSGIGDEPLLFELAEAWFKLPGLRIRRKVVVALVVALVSVANRPHEL